MQRQGFGALKENPSALQHLLTAGSIQDAGGLRYIQLLFLLCPCSKSNQFRFLMRPNTITPWFDEQNWKERLQMKPSHPGSPFWKAQINRFQTSVLLHQVEQDVDISTGTAGPEQTTLFTGKNWMHREEIWRRVLKIRDVSLCCGNTMFYRLFLHSDSLFYQIWSRRIAEDKNGQSNKKLITIKTGTLIFEHFNCIICSYFTLLIECQKWITY